MKNLIEVSRSLFREWRTAPAYLFAVLLAAAFVQSTFSYDFVAGNSEYFEAGDASQHVAGWLFYARDSWHFPLLHTDRINYPDGASIAFTDSIPLAALLFKPFASWLPSHFHYFGLWHVVVFLLQGIAAAFLIRSFGIRHPVATFFAVMFSLTSPALLARLTHTSLMTHAIILFALGIYFRGISGRWSARRAAAASIVLCMIALLVHPYFLAFCYATFLAFLVDLGLKAKQWKPQLVCLAASIAILCFAGWIFGYFGNATTTFGFGMYSMNLVSPFCASRFYWCMADATGGQYEGFNYLGAGVILLACIVVVTRWPVVRRVPAKYPALSVLLLLFVAYAVSNKIYWGNHLLFSYPLPGFLDTLTGTFRASGRFFWVVGYALLFGVLAVLLRRASWPSVLLVAVALAIQWFDMHPLRTQLASATSAPATNDLAIWKATMERVDEIDIFPSFGCAENDDPSIYWFFQRLAAYHGKLLNTGYVARPRLRCEDGGQPFAQSLSSRHLYAMSANYVKNPFAVPQGFVQASRRGECVKWQNFILCEAGREHTDWAKFGLSTSPVVAIEPVVEWPAATLPTRVGVARGNRMVPSSDSRTGFLTYGPYIVLPPGRYRYTLRYVSRDDASRQVGKWDVTVALKDNLLVLASGPMHGSNGSVAEIRGDFTAEAWKAPLEIRTQYPGQGDVEMIGITLAKAP